VNGILQCVEAMQVVTYHIKRMSHDRLFIKLFNCKSYSVTLPCHLRMESQMDNDKKGGDQRKYMD